MPLSIKCLRTLSGIYKNPLDRQMGTISITAPILDGGQAKYNQLLAKNSLEQADLQEVITQQNITTQVKSILSQARQSQNTIRYTEQSIALAQKRSQRIADLYEAGKLTIDQYLEAKRFYRQLMFDMNTARVNYWKIRYAFI